MNGQQGETTRRTALLIGAGAVGAAALGSSREDTKTPERPASKVPASIVETVREHARPMTGEARDLDPLVEMSKDASFVLIGEASHGTHEFYATRAQLTRRLIREHGFNAVVVEADWPDAARVHRYVHGTGQDRTADQALSSFHDFPDWMWRNTDVRDFVAWLRDWNKDNSAHNVGFYGMDLYSLAESRDAVLRYAQTLGRDQADKAAELYRKLESVSDGQEYGRSAAFGWGNSATKGAKQQFEQLARRVDSDSSEPLFDAAQNARVVKNGEEYYRHMYAGGVNTWNLRDRHMADTLDAVAEHLRRRDGYARIAVWAHNSHLGDARATEARIQGEWNVGQLVRERHPGKAVLIGFSTTTGTVMAANDWGEKGHVRKVQPALPRSYERAFSETGISSFVLPLRDEKIAKELRKPLLQRAIGVVYRPQTERQSHYFEAKLAEQFDAIIHFENTRAVEPLPAAVTAAA